MPKTGRNATTYHSELSQMLLPAVGTWGGEEGNFRVASFCTWGGGCLTWKRGRRDARCAGDTCLHTRPGRRRKGAGLG